MKSDLEIAYENEMQPICEVARKLEIDEEYLEQYGKYKAKLDLDLFSKLENKPNGKLILVTAINPTKAGEGKSTTTIGLADALNAIGKKTCVCVREPSFGPVLGLKGGACGGGYAQVQPMDDINMHFTGDMHAITSANNAISALLDNSLHNGNPLNIDFDHIVWKRCIDMNDRALREIEIGLGAKVNGPVRHDGFDITVASEIMAVLCLSSSIEDLKERVARIIVAYNTDGNPVTVDDLGATGCVTLILKDAIKPNLVQTLDHNPAIIHGGPFANIAHGCNSLIATKLGLKLCDYVVTEAGFGADLGAEKFFDIKCRLGGLKPDAVVLVATIRALKMHGEAEDYTVCDLEALKKGICNLERHIDTIKEFGLPYVIAINKFESDSKEELDFLNDWATKNGSVVSLSEVFAKGALGGKDLAYKIVEACDKENNFKFLYDVNDTIENKLNTIVRKVYGGNKVVFTENALNDLSIINKLGYDNLPICVAKTPSSLTDDAKIVGRPTDFDITISRLKVSRGAGFVVAYTGTIMTMPGLSKEPNALKMDFVNGKSKGLF